MSLNLKEDLPVELVGLSKPGMNGKKGTLVKFDTEKGRWKVQVEGKQLLIKPTNIQPGLVMGGEEGSKGYLVSRD